MTIKHLLASGKIRSDENVDLSSTITEVLSDFNVDATVEARITGPVITRYTLVPGRGTRVREFTNLNTELSMETGGMPVNVQAPILGTNTVGIDIPNATRTSIPMHMVIDGVNKSTAVLPLALGTDVAGNVVIEDLAKAPHLLVAGQTGSGKSVGINSIITGLVEKHGPDTLEFLMVDPKVVELSVYNDLPHMRHPVITDPTVAVQQLNELVQEMEDRYHLLAARSVRNIENYNRIAADKLSYIVVIIDELADLMMTAGKEVEAAIVRIAQKARAVGIHLIVATQRPSTDVITGLMKANIPARISFKVASGIDSKIILDETGAENLLGRGDMFVKMGPAAYRAHGAWISDDESIAVVDYLKTSSKTRRPEAARYKLIKSSKESPEVLAKKFNIDLDKILFMKR